MLSKASKATLILLLCLGLAISFGCKSVDFGKPKLPELPSLAFWKKGDEGELPPPPARHFDPARFGGEAETQVANDGSSTREQVASDGSSTREQVADAGSSTRPNFDQYGRRLKDSASEVNDLVSKSRELPKNSLEKLAAQPIRKPYKLDDIAGDDELDKVDNKFNLDASNLKKRMNDLKTSTSNQLTGAQQDFQSALNSVGKLQPSVDSSVKAGGSFAGNDNSFAAAPIAKAVDGAKSIGEIGGGSFLPKSGAFSNVKQAGENAAAAVNNSLYDAQGRLRSASTGLANQAQGVDPNRLKTMFEEKLLAAQKQANAKSEAFKTGDLKAKDQLNALAGVSERTQKLITQPFPKIAAGGSFAPKTPSQTTNQTVSNSPLQINKPNSLEPNSFGSAKNDPVAQMRLEVKDAKRQIALLKAQVAAANQSAANQPSQRLLQNTLEGVVLPVERPNNVFDRNAGLPVANQYQGQSYSPASPQPGVSGSTNSGGDSNSFYPSTPYGGFGSTKNPSSAVGQAGFNSVNVFQNQVSRANVEAPVTSEGSDIPSASRIGNTVTEVLIPSTILSGSSSFAPGSTAPLR